jgi:hypothetical protein
MFGPSKGSVSVKSEPVRRVDASVCFRNIRLGMGRYGHLIRAGMGRTSYLFRATLRIPEFHINTLKKLIKNVSLGVESSGETATILGKSVDNQPGWVPIVRRR